MSSVNILILNQSGPMNSSMLLGVHGEPSWLMDYIFLLFLNLAIKTILITIGITVAGCLAKRFNTVFNSRLDKCLLDKA